MAYLSDRRTTGTPDPAEVITVTIGGKTFRAGRRTAAHLQWTDDHLRSGHMSLRVIQGSYNTGVAASAGTHDLDSCVDVEVVGASWLDGQMALRNCGWAAWYRYPPTFPNHIHMVSIGCPGPVGVYVPGQVSDYYAHRSGLAGHVTDNTWHPADIDSTVFDYPAYLKELDDMPAYRDWNSEDRKALANDVAAAVLAQSVDKDGKVSLKSAVNQVRNGVAKLVGK